MTIDYHTLSRGASEIKVRHLGPEVDSKENPATIPLRLFFQTLTTVFEHLM